MDVIDLTVIEKSEVMELDVVEKYNPYHDKRGRFTTAGNATSFSIGPGGLAAAREKEKARIAPNGIASTKVDMNDISDDPSKHSLSKHIDANGNLTPEREALHEKILFEALAGIDKAQQGEQTFYMLGGGSGAGKTTVRNDPASDMPGKTKAVTVDPDWVKTLLPEYQEMVKSGNTSAASYVHEESSALAKRINTVAQMNGYNVVYDGTGDGSVRSVEKKINEARSNGLTVKGVYVTIPTEVAVERCAKRGARSGRVVPDDTIRDIHAKVSQILPEVAHMFDEVKLFSNIDKVELIAQGGNGKGMTAINQKAYDDFLAKANR